VITVIGGSGFIGTRLCEILHESGVDFRIIDKQMSRFFPDQTEICDVRDVGGLIRATRGASTVINLAAEHRDDVSPRSLYDEVNVQGAENVCECAVANGISRIVFTSSVAVYGLGHTGIDESGTISPFNDYGRTKAEAEDVYRRWFDNGSKGCALTIVRPTVVFGERNRGNVYNLLRLIASGHFVRVGDGRNKKSTAYVDNVASFLIHALTFDNGYHLFNYVDKPDFSMNDLVETVYTELGRDAGKIKSIPYPIGMLIARLVDVAAFVSRKRFSISAIRVKKFCANSVFETSVGRSRFEPKIELGEAIRRTIRYEFLERDNDDVVFYSE
jgi:nucleoside-diphosphate-sugar epimerase